LFVVLICSPSCCYLSQIAGANTSDARLFHYGGLREKIIRGEWPPKDAQGDSLAFNISIKGQTFRLPCMIMTDQIFPGSKHIMKGYGPAATLPQHYIFDNRQVRCVLLRYNTILIFFF